MDPMLVGARSRSDTGQRKERVIVVISDRLIDLKLEMR